MSGDDYRLGSVGLLRMRGPANASFSAIALGGVVQFSKAQNSVLNAVSRGRCFSRVVLGRVRQKLAVEAGNISECCESRLMLRYNGRESDGHVHWLLFLHASSVILHHCKYTSDGLVALERHSH